MSKEKTATKKTKKEVELEANTENESVEKTETTDEAVEILYSEEELKKFQEDFDEFRVWLVNKPYLIDNRKKVIKSAMWLLKRYAKSDQKTAHGLKRIYGEIESISKNKDAYVSSMQLHALWYFLKDIEGQGLEAANHLILVEEFIAPVNDNYQFDYKRLEYLNGQVLAGNQQVPLSTEGFPEEIIKYDELVNWKEDWKLLQDAIEKRQAEQKEAEEAKTTAPADVVTEEPVAEEAK